MTREEWRRLCVCAKTAVDAIAAASSAEGLNGLWYMGYAATICSAEGPTIRARPLIYDRMTDAEKSEFQRLENAETIKALCELCLAVYKRELPKMRAEIEKHKQTEQ